MGSFGVGGGVGLAVGIGVDQGDALGEGSAVQRRLKGMPPVSRPLGFARIVNVSSRNAVVKLRSEVKRRDAASSWMRRANHPRALT
jgi:hypothetical protein